MKIHTISSVDVSLFQYNKHAIDFAASVEKYAGKRYSILEWDLIEPMTFDECIEAYLKGLERFNDPFIALSTFTEGCFLVSEGDLTNEELVKKLVEARKTAITGIDKTT